MSLDDRIFQQDGTLITKIDIFLLRVAQKIGNFFSKEDEETLVPAFRRFTRVSIGLTLFAGILFLANRSFMGVGLSLILIALIDCRSFFGKGPRYMFLGTIVPLEFKRSCLFILAQWITLSLFLLLLTYSFQAHILFRFNVFIAFLGTIAASFHILYMTRLGIPPSKKKKVRAKKLKLALNPSI